MSKFSFKAVVSTLLILCILFLAFSGALMFFSKTGVVWGMSRSALRAVHFWVAVSMCVLIPVHLILNLGLYRTELRTIFKGPGAKCQGSGDEGQERGEDESGT